MSDWQFFALLAMIGFLAKNAWQDKSNWVAFICAMVALSFLAFSHEVYENIDYKRSKTKSSFVTRPIT